METVAKDPFAQFFRLKRPCKNCPFLKKGAIELMPGRLEDIVEGLVKDDSSSFVCHKTLAPAEDDIESDHDQDNEIQKRRINLDAGEAMCAGAAAHLMKIGRPTIGMRLSILSGALAATHWSEAAPLVVDPLNGADPE